MDVQGGGWSWMEVGARFGNTLVKFYFSEKSVERINLSSKISIKLSAFVQYKAVELISLSSILNNTQLVRLLKALPCAFVANTVLYNLLQPISSSTFSFKKFLSNALVDQFLTDTSSAVCNSVNSSFKDPYHDHIATDDLEPRKESIPNQRK